MQYEVFGVNIQHPFSCIIPHTQLHIVLEFPRCLQAREDFGKRIRRGRDDQEILRGERVIEDDGAVVVFERADIVVAHDEILENALYRFLRFDHRRGRCRGGARERCRGSSLYRWHEHGAVRRQWYEKTSEFCIDIFFPREHAREGMVIRCDRYDEYGRWYICKMDTEEKFFRK